MKIRLIMLGRTVRPELRALLDTYAARIRRFVEIEIRELRETRKAFRQLQFAPGAAVVLLDEAGKQLSSTQFADWLRGLRDRGLREMVFLCGDADGFPQHVRDAAGHLLSLSNLTMSHELARVVLAEQIYRAFTILAGHPYAK